MSLPSGGRLRERGWGARDRARSTRRLSVRLARWLAVLGMVVSLSARARACLVDSEIDGGSPPVGFLYPNWVKAEVLDIDLDWATDALSCSGVDLPGTLTGLTLVNYGTATGGAAGDITGVYACIDCGGAGCTPGGAGSVVLTYAGIWTQPTGPVPVWTWGGTVTVNADICTNCSCVSVLRVFVDIGPCATSGNTVIMGPGFNDVTDPANPGGIYDNNPGLANGLPYAVMFDQSPKTITWVSKVGGVDQAAPGDTVDYTIYYGRPGTTALTNVVVTDSMPAYTHYVPGSAVPAPDLGWDPNLGPPLSLRWTIPGPLATAGGPTGQVTFSLSIDWGNMESFEPGSGDVAAPEGARLNNIASAGFTGTSCAVKGAVSPPVPTVVKRFLFWKVGDNDLLFAPQPGQPLDEMTYTIFVQNLSFDKTWWNVSIWDTSPPELNPWAPNEGLYDPCVGWTMTPTGCSPANAGVIVGGGKTMLTWKIDLPPGATLSLQWKAQLNATTAPGATAINRVSLLALGRPGIVDGTGSSVTPATFTHLALIILPTTYVSYVAFAANGDDKGDCPGYFISFFPLNKQTQFELRGIQYWGAGWSTAGGASQSIGCLIGDCINGFPGAPSCGLGAGAISGGGLAGCKAPRAPAEYNPSAFLGTCPPSYPFLPIYKVTSNSPVLWQLLTHIGAGAAGNAEDADTYAPSTTITYRGFMHYMYRRAASDAVQGDGDALVMFNTGLDAYGVLNPNQTTTVHMFQWDFVNLQWNYVTTWDLGPESLTVDLGPTIPNEGPYRTISSDTQLIVYEGMDTINQAFCCCGCADNYVAFGPTRETGNTVTQVGVGTVYLGAVPGWAGNKIVVGNTGAVTANYRLWRYFPDNPVAVGNVPADMAGTSGTWSLMGTDSCPPGLANAANPQIYGNPTNAPTYSSWKIELTSGGPIQVMAGANLFQGWSGGQVIQAASGSQTGSQYWLNTIAGGGGPCGNVVQVVPIFAPKMNMVIQGISELGFTASYTTNGPDQCVAFTAIPNAATKVNWQFNSLTGGAVIAQFIMCKITEKGFTAPFLQTGVHYVITAPPIAFVGQSFWITVTVVDSTQTTKDDYCGTTAFSSTDPNAQLAGLPMATANFTWTSSFAPCGSSPYNNGVKVFVNVVFTQLGIQTLMATDITDGSIAGLAAVMVVSADIKLAKSPRLSVAASGDTVQFKVCWSNYSSASGFSFVITDAIPQGTTYVPEVASAMDCGNTDGVPLTVAYSTVAQATPPAMTTLAPGTSPPATTQWLRWTVPTVGVGTTGCACYRVTVN